MNLKTLKATLLSALIALSIGNGAATAATVIEIPTMQDFYYERTLDVPDDDWVLKDTGIQIGQQREYSDGASSTLVNKKLPYFKFDVSSYISLLTNPLTTVQLRLATTGTGVTLQEVPQNNESGFKVYNSGAWNSLASTIAVDENSNADYPTTGLDPLGSAIGDYGVGAPPASPSPYTAIAAEQFMLWNLSSVNIIDNYVYLLVQPYTNIDDALVSNEFINGQFYSLETLGNNTLAYAANLIITDNQNQPQPVPEPTALLYWLTGGLATTGRFNFLKRFFNGANA